MGSQRVGHDWACALTHTSWNQKYKGHTPKMMGHKNTGWPRHAWVISRDCYLRPQQPLASIFLILYKKLISFLAKPLASGSMTSWQTEGGKVGSVTDFTFLGSKITADSDRSHEIKGCLFLGRKVMTNLESILKSRDITLLTKVHIVKATAFPVTYRCELAHKEGSVLKIWWFWTGTGEASWESLRQQGDQTSQS